MEVDSNRPRVLGRAGERSSDVDGELGTVWNRCGDASSCGFCGSYLRNAASTWLITPRSSFRS